MIEKIERIIDICQKYSLEEINKNYIYSDSIQFEFEKLYEDISRLSVIFKINNPTLPFEKLRGIRNRVAHDYESVSINILFDTATSDLPLLKEQLATIIK